MPLGVTRHDPTRAQSALPMLSGCLRMLGGALPGSKLGSEVAWLGRVHCKGLPLVPLSTGGSSATWGV